jgi:putative phosphoesterase
MSKWTYTLPRLSPTMRIAAIADVHGNLDALRVVLSHIRTLAPDLIVNLGDHVSGPLQPAETTDLLAATQHLAIRGNHDRQVLEAAPDAGHSDRYAIDRLSASHLRWLRALPATATVDHDILLCHGTPRSDLDYFLEKVAISGSQPATPQQIAASAATTTASVILCGHTHVPRAVRLDDGRLIVNPGSVGVPAYRAGFPFPHVMEAGTPHARYALLERTSASQHNTAWQVQFFQLEYDWQNASRLAASRNRPDLAVALATGRAHVPMDE